MKTNTILLYTALISSFVMVTGCSSGGGDSGNTPPTASNQISGVVAAGAPLSGFVAIKDSTGTVVNTAIGSDGRYTVDVENLTPPYIFFASGIAGGQAYTIASAATLDDTGGTVNITPLTDLIVGNVAGTDSVEFFNNPNFTVLTSAALDSAEANLSARLEPMLTEAGIVADFDLLNTVFSADHSGLDGLLDILDIDVDPDTDTATITYLLDNTVIINEDLATDTDTTTINVSTVDVTAAMDANAEIAQVLNNFGTLYSSGTPSVSQVSPFIDSAYLDNGVNSADTIVFLTSTNAADQQDIATFISQLTNYAISNLTSTTATLTYGNGGEMKMVNNVDGWQLLGNGRNWSAYVYTETYLDIYGGMYSTVSFKVSGTWTENNYLIAQGPGLPAAGIILVQHEFNSFFSPMTNGTIDARYIVDDTAIGNISDGDVYLLALYNDVNGDTNIYATGNSVATPEDATTLVNTSDDGPADYFTNILVVRPLLSTETSSLPTITTPTQIDLQSFVSGALDVVWTLPTGTKSLKVAYDQQGSAIGKTRVAEKFVSNTATSTVLTVPDSMNDFWDWSVIVYTHDEFNRVLSMEMGPGGQQ